QGAVSTPGDMTVWGSTVDVESALTVSLSSLNLGRSTLTGEASVTISGMFTWYDSTLSTTGTVTAQGGIQGRGDYVWSPDVLRGGTLVNQGVMPWLPNPDHVGYPSTLYLSDGSHFDNQGT